MNEEQHQRIVIDIDPTDTKLRNWCEAHGIKYRAIFTHWRDDTKHSELPHRYSPEEA